MALLFFDGFDHYGPSGDPVSLGKWGASTSATCATTTPRTGTGVLRMTSASSFLTGKPLPASGGCVVGQAVKIEVSTSWYTAGDVVQVREGATVHVALGIGAGPVLTVKRGATVLATGTTTLPVNTWIYVELKTTIDDANGSYAVWIDGIPEAALTVLSGADTRNGGTTGQWDRIHLGPVAPGFSFRDDVYICDTSGPAPRNTALGPVKVETLYPEIGNGSNVGLTPSTGTDHGALVDEATPNITDYNSSATLGAMDTYQYPPLALTGAILGLQANLYVQKSDAAARAVCAVVRTGGADYDGANVSPGTTFGYLPTVFAQKPVGAGGGDWSSADIASLEVGMKVTV